MTSEAIIKAIRDEVARTSIAATARLIGVSRPTLSAVLAGKYPADPAGILAKAAATLGGRPCPHTAAIVTAADCAARAAGAMPTHSPAAAAQWRACRACDNNPIKRG